MCRGAYAAQASSCPSSHATYSRPVCTVARSSSRRLSCAWLQAQAHTVAGVCTAQARRTYGACTTHAQHRRSTNTKMAHARCKCAVCVDKAACCVAHLQPFGHHVLITARAHHVLICRGCRAPLGRYARAVAARRLQLGSLRAHLAEPLGHARLGRLKRRRNRLRRTGVTAAPQPPIGPWAAHRRVPSGQRSWEPPAPGRQGQVSYRATHKVR